MDRIDTDQRVTAPAAAGAGRPAAQPAEGAPVTAPSATGAQRPAPHQRVTASRAMGARRRVAAAPISWGVCEVPGWGAQLDPDRVLGEMAQLGLTATELGPVGWLPTDAPALSEKLARHQLRLVGGFVPFVLHSDNFDPHEGDRMARLLAAAGADVMCAAVVTDLDWSAPRPLGNTEWRHLTDNLARLEEVTAAHGLALAVHPHAGTLIERAHDVERLIDATDTRLCLDTGHLLIGGADPATFARDHAARIVHVHLKDVDTTVAHRLNAGELTLVQAVQAGLFRPLGAGDADIAQVVRNLEANRYERWLVLEQDTAITGSEPPVGSGPVLDVRRSIEFLATVAPAKEEVI